MKCVFSVVLNHVGPYWFRLVRSKLTLWYEYGKHGKGLSLCGKCCVVFRCVPGQAEPSATCPASP